MPPAPSPGIPDPPGPPEPPVMALVMLAVTWNISAELPIIRRSSISGATATLFLYFSCKRSKTRSYEPIPCRTLSDHPFSWRSNGSYRVFKSSTPVVMPIKMERWKLIDASMSISACTLASSARISRISDAMLNVRRLGMPLALTRLSFQMRSDFSSSSVMNPDEGGMESGSTWSSGGSATEYSDEGCSETESSSLPSSGISGNSSSDWSLVRLGLAKSRSVCWTSAMGALNAVCWWCLAGGAAVFAGIGNFGNFAGKLDFAGPDVIGIARSTPPRVSRLTPILVPGSDESMRISIRNAREIILALETHAVP